MIDGDRGAERSVLGAVAGTRPYPWPFDGAPVGLAGPGTVLLVVTAAGTGPDDDVRARLDALATALRTCGGCVVSAVTRLDDATRPPPPTGPLVSEALVDHHVSARRVDAFYGTDLDLLLVTAGTRRLLLAGAPLETSVHSTLRPATARGLECRRLEDAALAHDPGLRAASLSTIEMSGGIFGAIGRSTDVVAALTAAPAPPSPALRKDPS